MTFLSPKRAYPGEPVQLTAHLSGAADTNVEFEVVGPGPRVLLRRSVRSQRELATTDWNVDIGDLTPPVTLRFTARLGPQRAVSEDLVITHPMCSFWTSTPIFLFGKGNGANFHSDPVAHAGLRKHLQNTDHGLHELSLLRTVRPTGVGVVGVDYDQDLLPALSDQWPKHRPTFIQNIRRLVEICHQEGVRVFAGYEVIPSNNKGGFLQFFRAADNGQGKINPALIEAHVEALDRMLFVDSDTRVDFDGIGFDIEIAETGPENVSFFTTFYRAMAKRLAARAKQLAYVAYQFSSPTTGPRVKRGGPPVPAVRNMMSQQFDIAAGHPNMIVRPLLYDGVQLVTSSPKDVRTDIADAVIRHATNVGLKPAQIQIGFKTRLVGSKPDPGRVSEKDVEDFIRLTLKQHRVGVIPFFLKSRADQPDAAKQFSAFAGFRRAYE